jgi:hypothetical protein
MLIEGTAFTYNTRNVKLGCCLMDALTMMGRCGSLC